MSPNRGRRPTSRKSGSAAGGGGRSTDPAATRRLGLLVFGITLVVLFVVIAIAEGLGQPSVPSGDVALVQDAPGDTGHVSEADFQRALTQVAAQAGEKKTPKPGEKKYEEMKESALNSILDTIWIQGQAEEMGISVTPKEVAKELKKLKKENFKSEAEYKKFLKQSHYTQADVNERVKLQMLGTQVQEQITKSVGSPSKDEIETYYEAAKPLQFTQKPTRDVRLVANKDKKKAEAAMAILEKDNSAKSWKMVAKKYSEDPSKSQGGLQKGLAEGTAEEPLSKAIFEAPEKKLQGLVKTPRFYYAYEVIASTPEKVQALSDVEAQIKSQLEQQAQQEQFSVFVTNYTNRWRSRTFCASGYTYERCRNFKPPAHPSTAPPGCYEAHPKGGMPEACPAPVFQLVPALPGTVSPVEPRGRPLAQRPIPAGGGGEETPTSSLPIPTPTP